MPQQSKDEFNLRALAAAAAAVEEIEDMSLQILHCTAQLFELNFS